MSKWQMEEIRKILVTAYTSKYKRPRTPKYGSMNKGFTEEELEKFFAIIDNPKFFLLFKYQATLGLRIGEAVRINVRDINFRTRELRIETEKARKIDYMLIPKELFELTIDYLDRYKEEIKRSDGFLFFTNSGCRHIEPNYARNAFREYIKKAGMDEIYASSNDFDNPIQKIDGKPRALHRFTTHSLRHSAITRFSKAINGNVIQACKFARHSRPDTTMIYIHSSKEELYRDIDKAFSGEYEKKLRRITEFWK
jgi:integrase